MEDAKKKRTVGRPRKYEGALLERKLTLRITDSEHYALMAHGLQEQKNVSDLIRARCADILTV